MDAKEIVEWMAYDMLSDKEFKEKISIEMQLEEQKDQSAAEESRRIIEMFKALGMIKK